MEHKNYFQLETDGALAIITYCRPPINMLSFEALGQLEQLLKQVSEMPQLSVVVLTGGVEGYFAAHADMEDVMRMERQEPPVGDPDAWERVNELLGTMPPLTVAAVNGQAWGGGCETALACNLILLSEGGHLRLLEVSKGVVPGSGGTQRLPRRIGVPRALRMLTSTEVVRGEMAVNWGLADALLPADGFMDHVRDWLAPVLAQPVHSVRAAKRVVLDGYKLPLEQGLALEKAVFTQLVSCEETKALGEKTVETL